MPTSVAGPSEKATADLLRFWSPHRKAAETSFGNGEEPDGILTSPARPRVYEGTSEDCPQESTSQLQKTRQDIAPLIRLAPLRAPRRRFDIVLQWEGVVREIEGDSVRAELLDLTDPSAAMEIMEIPLAEIPVGDQPLLKEGSVFYWSIGYETSPGGQIRRVSEIRVRRTPRWSQHTINAIRAKAASLFGEYSGNGEDGSTET